MIFEVSEGCSLFMGITKIDFNINWKNGFFSPSKTYLREEKNQASAILLEIEDGFL